MAERTNIATQMRAGDEDDNRSAEAIRQDIAAKRETISETVDKLGERIQETFNWREYIADYPGVAIGLAAGVGFLVSGIFKHRPTPQERIMDAVAELTEDLTDRVSGIAGDVIKKKMISGKTVKAALTAVVTKAALDFAKEKASGLLAGDGREKYDRRVGAQTDPTLDRADFEPAILNENVSRSSMSNY
jgi:ElaB/YqjD/DUF883 family membrane-anchored ribosome-binding protein